jgi:ABC-type amino acid transport substrate-binding protein
MIEAQVAAALALAERITVAAAAPAPDIKAKNRESSSRPERLARGNTEKPESASANDTDLLVALLMARPNIKSVPDLTGKTIAIDDRYSASNGIVRTAIVAAGAPEVQLSEGQATAINRLVNGEVPAAVLGLVSADAAEGFSEIAGFKIFHIPLSPRSLKAQP